MNGTQLRNSILQFAIQGKLVPQDPNDEPAFVLLEKIRAEKLELVKKNLLKRKDLDSIPIKVEDIPNDLPTGWISCRVKDVLLKITDGTHHSPVNTTSGEYKYVTAKNIKEDGIQTKNITYVSKKIHEEIYARCNPSLGDLLYVKDGATTGICCINNLKEPFSLLSSVALLKPSKLLYTPFLLWCLRSPICYDSVRESMKGTGITRITLTKIEKWIIPLPPLAEQKRIVAKLEEILPLVESYDKAQQKLDELNKALPDRLRKSILQEAIQGKLVEQDPSDEPASVLLERIREEKQKLVKEGRIKQLKEVEVPINEEKPYELPNGWVWTRLSAIVWLEDAPKHSGESLPYLEAKYLRGKVIGQMLTEGKLALSGNKAILVDGENSGEVFTIKEKGYLGSTFKLLGIAEDICSEYALTILATYKDLFRNNKRGSAIPHLNKELFSNLLIGLPPLAEQKRIVAKLDELLKLIK